MKKKLLFLVLSVLVPHLAFAQQVDSETAHQRAREFLSKKGVTMVSGKSPAKIRKRGTATKPTDASYYVFNAGNDKGYVIVSGDDRTEEILGYVDNGSFDENEIPENMKSWLQYYDDQISALPKDVPAQSNNGKAQRHKKLRPTRHSVPVLMTTTWNQGDPYNSKCPVYYKPDGTTDLPASGCVATALAQVMYYYKHPARTRLTIPSIKNTYTLSDGTQKTVTTKNIPRGSVLDWDNMVNNYKGGETEEQRDAVGNLMYYIGQSVGMGYGASSGAVFGQNVSDAFTNYFNYDDAAHVAYRSDYTIDEWFDLIYEEIASGHPVAFSGSSSGGAHAFVLDGFDGENLFHLNWGWGGSSDGWFLIGILNPGDNTGIGASSSSDGYSMGQNALIGLRMPDNIREPHRAHLTVNDIKIEGSTINANYINWTGQENTFNIGIVQKSEDGSFRPVGTTKTISLGKNIYMNMTFNVKGRLSEGTHILSPASKLTTSREWQPQYDCIRRYIKAVVDDKGDVTLELITPVESISIDTIIFPGNRVANEEQEVKVIFRNNGDEYYKEVHLLASTSDEMAYQENRSIVAIKKGESTAVSFFFKPTEVGTYNLWFSNNREGTELVGTGKMEVIDASDASLANLSVSGFSISNTSGGNIYGNKLLGYITVKNNGREDFDGRIKAQLWRQEAGSNTAYTSTGYTVAVQIARGRTSMIPFEFSNLDYGPTYRIQVNYVGQSGSLPGGGLWDHGWVLKEGFLTWRNTGSIVAVADKSSLFTSQTICGVYLNGGSLRRVTPNKNINTIYQVEEGTTPPTGLENSNLVVAGHASKVSFANLNPYYVPSSFTADSAYFYYNFDETTNGTKWEAFTMPFRADSIYIDSVPYALNDSTNHFWIYEFAFIGEDNEIIFEPAETLRGNTPYIIAADSTMAGKTVTFFGQGVPFFTNGADKMLVSSDTYNFYGSTYVESVKNAYVMNEEGTAFVYTDKLTNLDAMEPYFLTILNEESRAASIELPAIPTSAATGIISTKTKTTSSQDIFSISGTHVGKMTNNRLPQGLKPGIYIMGGKKILVK